MKALSIGRDQACDIVINDSTDVISRRHAILNIAPSGKMTIVDQSRNGTYVNGIRISPNVPVPVSKKDIVSFAHVAKLDWNAVPASTSYMRYVIMGTSAVIVAICVWFAISYLPGEKEEDNKEKPKAEVIDSSSIQKKKEELKKDSINDAKIKQLKDSLEQVKKEKVVKNKKEEDSKKKDGEKKPTVPKDSTKNRPIG